MANAKYVKGGKLSTKHFPLPKRVDRLLAWLNAARKVVPEIPMDSEVATSQATVDIIQFTFKGHTEDQPHALLIERRAN